MPIYNLNVKQFGSQMKPHILWGFIWIQIVCKGHQRSSKFTASGLRVNLLNENASKTKRFICWMSSRTHNVLRSRICLYMSMEFRAKSCIISQIIEQAKNCQHAFSFTASLLLAVDFVVGLWPSDLVLIQMIALSIVGPHFWSALFLPLKFNYFS